MSSAPTRARPGSRSTPDGPQRRSAVPGRGWPGRPTCTPGRHELPTTPQPAKTQLTVDGQWCKALFASTLQPSDSPTPGMIAQAAACALQQFGARGCAGRMTQEFGDHPGAAASRMRWVRQLPIPCPAGEDQARRPADLAAGGDPQ
jgi:hypothetical protein